MELPNSSRPCLSYVGGRAQSGPHQNGPSLAERRLGQGVHEEYWCVPSSSGHVANGLNLVTWALPGSVRVARGIDLIVLSDTSVIFKTHKRAWKRYELSIVDIIIPDSGD